MKPYYQDASTTILHGDCIETMRTMPDDSIDSIVTDPPYGLGFMGKKWDALPPGEEWARECLRVLKPGGHILAFGGSRTWHRLAVAIEDAGFEIRDGVLWLYGSGFPKSMNVGKAIDKLAGAERTVPTGVKPGHERFVGRDGFKSVKDGGALSGVGGFSRPWMDDPGASERYHQTFAPATPEAAQWEGWGTALKPAYEPAVMARKPFTGTVAGNVLEHGTGAINIDASRIEHDAESAAWVEKWSGHKGHPKAEGWGTMGTTFGGNPSGRWPANVILDEHTAELLDQQSGTLKSPKTYTRTADAENLHTYGAGMGRVKVGDEATNYGDQGGASRFFYCAKAGKSERPVVDGVAHATVKPLKLMRYLVRMVTPPGGTVLDPFAGSGTTIEAAILEGFNSIGIERETDYLPLIQHRINRANGEKP